MLQSSSLAMGVQNKDGRRKVHRERYKSRFVSKGFVEIATGIQNKDGRRRVYRERYKSQLVAKGFSYRFFPGSNLTLRMHLKLNGARSEQCWRWQRSATNNMNQLQ